MFNWDVPGYIDPVEVGILEEFQYKVVGSNDSVTVATTRLETMLGTYTPSNQLL